ncbi:MAG: hypothetical protein ACKVS6_05795 [Planctomycetota bacterium]
MKIPFIQTRGRLFSRELLIFLFVGICAAGSIVIMERTDFGRAASSRVRNECIDLWNQLFEPPPVLIG